MYQIRRFSTEKRNFNIAGIWNLNFLEMLFLVTKFHFNANYLCETIFESYTKMDDNFELTRFRKKGAQTIPDGRVEFPIIFSFHVA